MTNTKICILIGLLIALIILIFTANILFLSNLSSDQTNPLGTSSNAFNRNVQSKSYFGHQIRRKLKELKPIYLNKNPRYYGVRNQIWKNFRPNSYDNVTTVWDISYWWPSNNEIYPQYDSTMSQLLHALRTENIVSVRNAPRGTQLKLLLELSGKQKVIFKPKWYERDAIISGPVYAGKDRFNAEIVAFYLGAMLNLRWTPIVVGRRINLKEIYEKTSDKLLKSTMIVSDDHSKYCVFGKCFYCKEDELVCGDENHELEGSVIHFVPGIMEKHRSPWQRTYKDNQLAPWEENNDYCTIVKEKVSITLLLDLVDVAIFDFIIQNGDRHHFETRNERVILIDNGKGFGNPNVTHIDILAPLYQCCVLRRTTYDRLAIFSGRTFTELLNQLTKLDLLYPLLTEHHFKALERRLLTVYAAIEVCFDRWGKENVLK